ncbi:hypothetical protein [Raoultella terrigena]|uniref:hypothetical protein n=1 Tax=Raoultella terrigena TaxID=577 RepID=UPI000F4CF8C6|nr:hypothetical protein [Raoultella terrigena]
MKKALTAVVDFFARPAPIAGVPIISARRRLSGLTRMSAFGRARRLGNPSQTGQVAWYIG